MPSVVHGAIRMPQKPQRKIHIAVPAYQSLYHGATVRSLLSATAALQRQGIATSFSDIDYSDIVVSRNYLISNFYLNKDDCSHILFLDNDMGFEVALILDMLQLGKDVVGAIYPRREIDLAKLHAGGGENFAKAKAAALNFIVTKSDTPETLGKFMKVAQCGTGIFLVSRAAIRTMIEKCPEIVDDRLFKGMPFASRFSRFLTPFDKIRTGDRELSEDFSFCHRWTQACGGEIWASFDHPIRHVGSFVYEARFSDL